MDDREYGAVVAIAKWVLRADSPVGSGVRLLQNRPCEPLSCNRLREDLA
jgi:hypothetical protein